MARRRRRRSQAPPDEESPDHTENEDQGDANVVDLAESDSDIEILGGSEPLSQEQRDHQIAMDLQRQLDREFMGRIMEEQSDDSDLEMNDIGPALLGLVRNFVARFPIDLADEDEDDDDDAQASFNVGDDGDDDGKERDADQKEEQKDAGDASAAIPYNFRQRTVQQRRDQEARRQIPVESRRRRRGGAPSLPVQASSSRRNTGRRVPPRSVRRDRLQGRRPTPPPPRQRRRGGGIRDDGGLFGPGFRVMFRDAVFGIDDEHNIFFRNVQRGADATEIHALPTSKYKPPRQSSQMEKPKCLICLEELKSGDSVRTLPCFHVFHTKEIDTWLRQNVLCPICRQPIRSS